MEDCKEKKFNLSLFTSLMKASVVTAVGYTAWQYVTRNMKQDWSRGKSYATLFIIVLLSLVLANLVFVLIFQSKKIYHPVCKKSEMTEDEIQKNSAYFI